MEIHKDVIEKLEQQDGFNAATLSLLRNLTLIAAAGRKKEEKAAIREMLTELQKIDAIEADLTAEGQKAFDHIYNAVLGALNSSIEDSEA